MKLKNIAFVLLIGITGCAPNPEPEIKEYIGKYRICSPEEFIQKNFPNLNPYAAVDSFSINYYHLNENKIKGSTLEIFADTTFVVDCEILNDNNGAWEKYDFAELGNYLALTFGRATANFYYEREGYRICIFPISLLKEKIPLTEYGPVDLQLVYKKINAYNRVRPH